MTEFLSNLSTGLALARVEVARRATVARGFAATLSLVVDPRNADISRRTYCGGQTPTRRPNIG